MRNFEFENAYNYFNKILFDDMLPAVIITLQRKKNSYGYFSPDRFSAKYADGSAHELALNPDHFARDDKLVLSTLVHEMCHVWQQELGKPSRNGYHNKQWADKMEWAGLMPSNTGTEGGKRTGAKVSHYIIQAGKFDREADRLLDSKFRINWAAIPAGPAEKKQKDKIKYTCPDCGLNAWGKPDIKLICGICAEKTGEIVNMEAEETD